MCVVRRPRRVVELLMSPGSSESMRKLHEPCGARLVADVAHALLRAVSRLISTPALLFDTVCESWARTVEKSLDAARRSACATPATTCPTLAHPVSSTSGGLRPHSPAKGRLKGGCSQDWLPHVTPQILLGF